VICQLQAINKSFKNLWKKRTFKERKKSLLQ